ncbi:MAG: hypothetical protein ACM3ZF_08750 [Mycobacterium leprae]
MEGQVRWEGLFADLEAQLDAADAADLAVEVTDRTRREVGRLRLVDRLRPAQGSDVAVTTTGAGTVRGRVTGVGADWILLVEPGGRAALVPMGSVLSISGLLARSAEPGSEGAVASRIDLRFALRGLVRDRATVLVTLVNGSAATGTIDRVGADFVEIAEHAPGEPRRAAAVRAVRTLPLRALALVRSA